MKNKTYQWILYTIVAVIATTIAIQIYWNYKNYLNNKQQLISDVQSSLDQAVDDYYARLAERTTYGVFLEGEQQKNAFEEGGEVEKLMMQFDSITENEKHFFNTDSIFNNRIEGITVLKGSAADSMAKIIDQNNPPLSTGQFMLKMDSLKLSDSKSDLKNIEFLTSKIVVSIRNDSLNVEEVDSLLIEDFKRKQIDLDHDLVFYKSSVWKQVAEIKDSINASKGEGQNDKKHYALSAVSKSTFLPKGSILELNYSNETLTVLKRSFSGILISTILVLAVISCLFYLLNIIKRQKQLAEVKNDLISNITHEFKTPIATIGVALESIRDFNGIEDREKTKKYLAMSSQQLEKLNIMVEKLLETATLDSDRLELNKDSIDITELLRDLHKRYEVQFQDKTFILSIKADHYNIAVDLFHLENALNNILENAVKYGGSTIYIDLTPKSSHIEIAISDNGTDLTKANKERIFEKFYRVTKGNTHDVKGFGIGLFYTKTIIEKHGGTITVELENNLTTFKMTIPNG